MKKTHFIYVFFGIKVVFFCVKVIFFMNQLNCFKFFDFFRKEDFKKYKILIKRQKKSLKIKKNKELKNLKNLQLKLALYVKMVLLNCFFTFNISKTSLCTLFLKLFSPTSYTLDQVVMQSKSAKYNLGESKVYFTQKLIILFIY